MNVFEKRGDTQGTRSYGDRGRDLNDAATSQEAPEAGRDRNFSPEPSDGAWPCQYLAFRLLDSRTGGKYISLVLNPQVCGYLLWQPQGTTTVGKAEAWYPNSYCSSACISLDGMRLDLLRQRLLSRPQALTTGYGQHLPTCAKASHGLS